MWQGSDTTAIFEISQHRNWNKFGHRVLATVDRQRLMLVPTNKNLARIRQLIAQTLNLNKFVILLF